MTMKVELHKRSVKLKERAVQYWTLRWWGTDGKRYSESIGRVGDVTKHEAERMRREKEQAIGGGKLKRNRPREVTLAEFIKLDVEAVRGTVKLNTVESIRHSSAHALKAWGASTRLSSISRAHANRLKAHLLDEAGVSETTMAKTMRTLKAMFNRAMKDGLIHENPLAGVRMPKTPSRRKRVFAPYETRAMRSATPSLWWRSFIALAETTGFRKGELLNLMWRDVDFELKIARVSAKQSGRFELDGNEYPLLGWEAKSHEARAVPLPEWVLSVLAQFQVDCDESPYVFLNLDRLFAIGTEMGSKGALGPNYELVNNLSRQFDLLQRMGREYLAREKGVALRDLAWERGTIHDLRRTYGTRMARVIPMHVLKEYMGHAKIATTQEFYLAAETQDADRARDALEALTDPNRTSRSGRNQDAIGPNGGFSARSASGQKRRKSLRNRDFHKRGGRDSNPQPPDRQSGTLTN